MKGIAAIIKPLLLIIKIYKSKFYDLEFYNHCFLVFNRNANNVEEISLYSDDIWR